MKNRVGEVWVSNEGYKMTLVTYNGNKDCSIKFDDGLILSGLQYVNIKKGEIKNPHHPSVCGKGYKGVGKHLIKCNGKHTEAYVKWHSMLVRCYDIIYQKRQPNYIGCEVSEEWLNFQTFGDWFELNYKEGYALDKDILTKGNKIYSDKTCCFVPQEINSLFIRGSRVRGEYPIGVSKEDYGFRASVAINGKQEYLGIFKTPEKAFKAYKEVKEKEIKKMARLCKTIISPEAYKALINYEVEITD